VLVGDGDDEDVVGFDGIQDAEGKPVQQTFSDFPVSGRPGAGIVGDAQGSLAGPPT
jgi:hypothetical protein